MSKRIVMTVLLLAAAVAGIAGYYSQPRSEQPYLTEVRHELATARELVKPKTVTQAELRDEQQRQAASATLVEPSAESSPDPQAVWDQHFVEVKNAVDTQSKVTQNAVVSDLTEAKAPAPVAGAAAADVETAKDASSNTPASQNSVETTSEKQ